MADGERVRRLGALFRKRPRSRPRWGRLRGLARFVRSTAGVRVLGATLILLGLASAGVLLARPVEAAFPDDFLLRYSGLGASPVEVPKADCGSALDAVSRDADASSLATLARDAACREEASRRVAVALASGGVIVVAGMMGLYLSSPGAVRRTRTT